MVWKLLTSFRFVYLYITVCIFVYVFVYNLTVWQPQFQLCNFDLRVGFDVKETEYDAFG